MRPGVITSYEPINPRFHLMLIGLGLVTILGMGIWITPPMLSLYYQTRGGLLMDDAKSNLNGDIQGRLACDLPPVADRDTSLQIEQAAGFLQKAIQLNQKNDQAHLQLGQAYCFLGQPDKAESRYQSYLELRPGNPIGHLELGYAHKAQNETSLAIKEWEIVGLTSQDFMASGEEERRRGNYDEAVVWYESAAIMGALDAQVFILYTRGLGQLEHGLAEASMASFQEAISRDENNSLSGSAYYHIGLLQQDNLKQWDKALESYKNAIALESFLSEFDWADTRHRKGVILKYAYGEGHRAMDEFRTAVEILPSHYGALMELGWSYWELDQDFRNAERSLQRAITANPSAKWAYTLLGNLYDQVEMFEESISMYEKALQYDPEDAEIKHKIQVVRQKIDNEQTDRNQ